MATLRITDAGERQIGLAFLQGCSIGEIATYHCCSTRAIESVIRGKLQHLLKVKPEVAGRVSAEDLREIYRAMTPEMRAELWQEPRQVDVNGVRMEE